MSSDKQKQDPMGSSNVFTELESLPSGVTAVATRGKTSTLYVRAGVDPKNPKAMGILENRATGSIVELPVQSVMARGYWEILPYEPPKRSRPKPQLPAGADE